LKLLKTHPFLSVVNSYVIDSPAPSNISYLWNYGSLLGFVLIIQIVTGVTLAMHYVPHIDLAFISVEHITRDVNYNLKNYFTYFITKINNLLSILVFILLILTILAFILVVLTKFIIFITDLFFYTCQYSYFMSSFVPLMIYHNAETEKDKILKDNKGKTGIYMWIHKKSLGP
jgi:hypothetical protein